MHQADAGSDAYDRGFALSLLSQEQDALYEIEEALKRVDAGTYGICEMSGKPIPHARLEAIPFARFTVECQTQIEKQKKAMRLRQPVKSLEEGGEGEEDTITDSKWLAVMPREIITLECTEAKAEGKALSLQSFPAPTHPSSGG